MPRIPVHAVADAPDKSRPALEALAARMGRVLNIHGEMAHAPAVVHAYVALNRALTEHGSFDSRTREAIALAVGAVDHCDYCQAAHTLGAQGAGFTLGQTISLRSGEVDFDTRLAALIAVVRQVAGNVGHVDEATWQAALEAGWSDEELTEAFAHVIANIFTSYFNHMVGTELALPAAPPARLVPAAAARASVHSHPD